MDPNSQLLNNTDETMINKQSNQKKKTYISWLPRMYWFFYRKPLYFLVFVPSLLSGIVTIVSHLFMGYIIDSLKLADPFPSIRYYAFLSFVLSVVCAICNFINYMFWIRVGSSIGNKIKSVLFKALMEKDVTYFDTHSIGEIFTLLKEESSTVENIFSSTKTRQIRGIGQLVSSIIVTFSLEWRLASISLGIAIMAGIITRQLRLKAQESNKKRVKSSGNALTVVEEALSNIRIVSAFNRGEKEHDRYMKRVNESIGYSRLSSMYFFLSMNIGKFFSWGTIAVVVNLGGYLVLKNQISAGMLFALTRAAFMFDIEINMLLGTYNQEVRANDSCNQIWEVVDDDSSIAHDEGIIPETFNGKIEFCDVWFKYPTRDSWVLKNVSFTVNPDDTIAIVGHSGSGKSTITQLLLRFYEVTAGTILVDGIDIKLINPRFLHQVFGVVQQDPILFSMSIRDNILYGKPTALVEEVIEAARISHSLAFINELSNGFDTMVGEKGLKLSGGQRQRIAIARAVIRNPKVLISDEATSALDTESEKNVLDALEEIMVNRTSIIIAHRLATIRSASKIYVLDQGELAESGTHDQLVSNQGIYFSLIQRQLIE